jgi:hypothetical protein
MMVPGRYVQVTTKSILLICLFRIAQVDGRSKTSFRLSRMRITNEQFICKYHSFLVKVPTVFKILILVSTYDLLGLRVLVNHGASIEGASFTASRKGSSKSESDI